MQASVSDTLMQPGTLMQGHTWRRPPELNHASKAPLPSCSRAAEKGHAAHNLQMVPSSWIGGASCWFSGHFIGGRERTDG